MLYTKYWKKRIHRDQSFVLWSDHHDINCVTKRLGMDVCCLYIAYMMGKWLGSQVHACVYMRADIAIGWQSPLSLSLLSPHSKTDEFYTWAWMRLPMRTSRNSGEEEQPRLCAQTINKNMKTYTRRGQVRVCLCGSRTNPVAGVRAHTWRHLSMPHAFKHDMHTIMLLLALRWLLLASIEHIGQRGWEEGIGWPIYCVRVFNFGPVSTHMHTVRSMRSRVQITHACIRVNGRRDRWCDPSIMRARWAEQTCARAHATRLRGMRPNEHKWWKHTHTQKQTHDLTKYAVFVCAARYLLLEHA